MYKVNPVLQDGHRDRVNFDPLDAFLQPTGRKTILVLGGSLDGRRSGSGISGRKKIWSQVRDNIFAGGKKMAGS